MKKIKIITGITWAFIGLFLIIILFPGLNFLSSSAAKLPFMKINPNYTGGEVGSRFISSGCTLVVRKPVFDGLLRERKQGFVQVDWRGKIPAGISDTIDYNSDGINDFIINIITTGSQTSLISLNPKVRNVEVSTITSYGWAARVKLIR